MRALHSTDEETEKGQTVIAKHFREYLEMKDRFGQ